MPSEWPSFNSDRVRDYYERHTRTFVALGEGGGVGALHRAVLAPGVTSKAAAFRYVEDRIAAAAEPLRRKGHPLSIVDLGCGVGGSLCYLAERLPMHAIGVTLSPIQAALARRRISAAGLDDRIGIRVGDYLDADVGETSVDLVYAIESFVHASDARRFLMRCAHLLRPGGRLVICDDFLRGTPDPRAARFIERFRRGWHVNTLLTAGQLQTLAHDAGFRHLSTDDLTPHVDIGRPRDRLVDVLAGSLERLPWRWRRLDPWLGGSALQQCLRNRWIGYDFAVLERAV